MNNIGFELIKSSQVYILGIASFVIVGGAAMIALLVIRDKIKSLFKKRGKRG